MIWYYINGEGKQVGPLEEAEFGAAIKSGVVRGDTQVWNEGMPAWKSLSETGNGAATTAIAGSAARCSECGRVFPQDEMVNFERAWVCASCKPLYVQKLREGAPTGSETNGWRSGKRLVIATGTSLPHRCVKCNEPNSDPQKKRKLYWHHPTIYLTILISLLVYVIIAICCRKRATTFVSVCPRHRAARRNAIIVSWIFSLGGIFGLCYGIGTSSDPNSIWFILAGIVVFLVGLIYGMMRGRIVYATKITKEFVWLGGCSPVFLAEFPEWTGPK